MKNIEPCKVCGSTDANLIDGYYYCVECGTQDVNVRETVVEEMELADGTISFKTRKKIYKTIEEGDNLSGEWYKWHAFNFIIVGLADEMIEIGAKPSFKKKLLWLWTEYMKKFQNKEELRLNTDGEDKENNNEEQEHYEENDSTDNEEETGFYDEELFKFKKRPRRRRNDLKMNTSLNLSVMKRSVIFSLIYVALQLDCNDIHVTDLFRFMKQGKFNILNCEKHIPKEIIISKIPQWSRFYRSKVYIRDIERYIMTVYKCFQIVPPVPDLKVLVHRYAKELCLPDDFKNLVFSLMHLLPCDYLKIDLKIMKSIGRVPFYECIVMSYFLVVFKMLFGLDDDYELRLSEVVDKINDENCYLKSYNLGNDSEPTDRLFSFREWCNFIQLRKMVVCKNYLFMAKHYEMPIDDFVYMEQRNPPKSRKPTLSDEITMTLLNRIPQEAVVAVIPISEFKATLTPMFSASEVILQYFNDPDLKLLFSEDFTQYSLKYATEKLYLKDSEEYLVGVSKANKVINNKIIGSLQTTKNDISLVYVRNCDNKNWLKTNQPSVKHVKKVENNRDSDHGYDSNIENASTVDINDTTTIDRGDSPIEEDRTETTTDSAVTEHISIENSSGVEISRSNATNFTDGIEPTVNETKVETDENELKSDTLAEIRSNNYTSVGTVTPHQDIKKEREKIEEEEYDRNIFDDDFADLVEVKPEPQEEEIDNNARHIDDVNDRDVDDHQHFPSTSAYDQENRSETSQDDYEIFFNEATFDREKTIRELVLATCKKYKIQIPKEYRTQEPKKRKSQLIKDSAGESGAKKRKLDDGTQKKRAPRGKVKDEINNLLVTYYENLRHDVLHQVSEHVKALVNNISRTHEEINNSGRIQGEVANYDDNVREPSIPDTTDHHRLNTENNTYENIETAEPTLDQSSSVQFVEDETEARAPEDPRFDENEYDPKQLYVRIEEEAEIEDVYDVADDPDIAAILDRKIEEINKGELRNTTRLRKKSYESDEDEVPLSVLRAEKESISQKGQYVDNLTPLLSNIRHVDENNYWARHYYTDKLRKAHDCYEPFYIELDKHYPKNFTFVLKECADVISYTPFRLYRTLMDLERRLLCYSTLND